MDERTNKINSNNLLNATKNIDKDQEESYVGHKEFKSMKNKKYNEKKKNIDTSYVIQHKKTGQIVEVKAISEIMAAKTVGWRPRHIKVLKVISN